MRRVTQSIKRLVLPQLAVSFAAVLALCGGLAMASTHSVTRPVFIVHWPATPHVAHISTVAPVDCAKLACFALTFDDGPDGTLTPQILDILDRQNVRATFFVLGSRVHGHEDILRRMHKSGRVLIGTPSGLQIPLEQVDAEVMNTQAAIAAAGVPAPKVFRPPYGDFNDAVLAHIPLTVIRWNIDPEDWNPKKYNHMIEHVAAHARPGGMLIVHDSEPATLASLDQIINELKARNYTFVTVSELLDLPAGQHGVFYGR